MMEFSSRFLLLFLFALAAVQNANSCNKETKNPVDGKFGAWTKWTICDVSCGTGSHSRERHCDNPAPKNKGKKCSGATSQTRPCYVWRDSCQNSCFSFPVTDESAGVGARAILTPLRKLDLTSFTLDVEVTMRGRWACPEPRTNLKSGMNYVDPVCGPTLVGFSRLHGIGAKFLHVEELLWLTAGARMIVNQVRVLGQGSSEKGLRGTEVNRKERHTVTWNGRSGKTVVYIDGIRIGAATKKQRDLAKRYGPLGEGKLDERGLLGPGVFMLGQNLVRPWQKHAALQQFMGDLCNFQMWDRVLTKGELKSLFQGKVAPAATVFDNPPTYEYTLKDGAEVKP